MNFGGPDLIVILLIILVLFGAKKLPELAKGMGQAMREFQKAKDDFSDELHKAGRGETASNDPEVRTPSATVPRIEDASSPPAAHPDPDQTSNPGGRAEEIRGGR